MYEDAGLPPGAYENVFASNEQIEWVIADPRVRGVSVTGSERAGAAVRGADPGAVGTVRADLETFARKLDLPGEAWPVYGALIVNLRNIVAALDTVAEAQPVEVPSPALVR